MNCQEFETIVNDLAGGRLWDGRKRETGLAHTGECPRCSARLANERLLSYELVELGREERQVQAPHRLKADLMAAFAAQHAAPAAAPVAAPLAEVVAFPQRSRTPYWAMAIAAAAIVALGLIIPLRSWLGRGNPAPQASVPTVAPLVPPAPVAPPVIAKPGNETVATNTSAPAPVPTTVSARPTQRNRNTVRSQDSAALNTDNEVASNTEVTTGFIPLTYLNDATAADSGVMLRVQVARDRLATMGLPVNLDRYGETIKADIIMGDDGVARAIRLVQ